MVCGNYHKPRGHVEIDNTEDEMPYQSDAMSPVLPIAKIESISCLHENSQMTNKGGSDKGNAHPTRCKPKMLRPAPSQPPTSTKIVVPADIVTPPSHPTPSPIHASTLEVFVFMSTLCLSIDTMGVSSQHSPHETLVEKNVQQNFDDHEDMVEIGDHIQEDEEVGQGNVPPIVPVRDDNGKVIIRPYGKGLTPNNAVADAIRYAIQKQFCEPIYGWSATTNIIRQDWFETFAEKVSWDPCHNDIVKRLFEQKTAKSLSDMLTKVRKKGTRPSWIGVEAWTGLQAYWEDILFKNISNQNKTNRALAGGGVVHISCRKAHIDVAIELSNNLQRDLLPNELFLTTHKRKNGTFKNKLEEVQTQLGETSEESAKEVDGGTILKLWTESAGGRTLGRVYGTFKNKLEEVQTQLGETSEESAKEVDGGTILKLWTESAGGRTLGRVYGTEDLSINVRHGCVSLTQHSQNPSNSMTGMSLEAERAARIRVEQLAQDAMAQAQVATKVAEEAWERSKKLENDFDALKQFFGDKIDALQRQSAGGSSTASLPPSHPHYDHILDDLSLDEP
uniref:Uncharacterized protein LOC101512926 n=1 Tax=Cicer arietinum TaxID=3827 RepID=A0A1S3E102_CICAR|nr:uncharacterized protein LOC101512926 [Cicer arietinum]